MKNFTASTPTTLGAALLVLSGALFAVDVGGTYALDAGDANLDVTATASAPATTSPAAAPADEPQAGVASTSSLLTVHTAMTPIHVERARTKLASKPAPHRARRQPHTSAARRVTSVKPKAREPKHSAAPVVLAKAPSAELAPARQAAAPRSHVQPLATLRQVRRYVMRALASEYKHLCVISATTYPKDGRVLVDLVVRDGNKVWYEKDVVKRTGTTLAIASRKQHVLPRSASKAPAPAEPDSFSGES